ncbi:Amino acid transporter AVT1A [Nymphon striatum]|nr:Amino acid transporter AVT1A [Nymphon striatum]
MENEQNSLLAPVDKTKNISAGVVSLLIVSGSIGGGCLVLPNAIQHSRVVGLIFIIVIGSTSCYCGIKLGNCLQIIAERWPKYDKHIPDPYPVIAELCFGPIVRAFIRINLHIILSGNVIVLILLASQITDGFEDSKIFSRCSLVFLVGCAVVLPSWFGTPKDFWQVGIISIITIAIPIFIIIWELLSTPEKMTEIHERKPYTSLKGISFAYGIIVFLYGSVGIYPSLQMDMKHKDQFRKALLHATIIMTTVFFVVGYIGYKAVPYAISSNVALILKEGLASEIAKPMLVIHLITQNLLCINPVNQDIEQFLEVPKEFCWKRVISRTIVIAFLTFIALTFSNFAYIMNVIGASSMVFLVFVCPLMFFMKLASMKSPVGSCWPEWYV